MKAIDTSTQESAVRVTNLCIVTLSMSLEDSIQTRPTTWISKLISQLSRWEMRE